MQVTALLAMSHSELAEEQERGEDEKEDEQEEEEGGERRRAKEEKKKEERKMYLEKLRLTKKRLKSYLCVIFEHVYIKLMQAISFPELFLKKEKLFFGCLIRKRV